MSHADFVHLHVHTAYSLLEGAIKTGALAAKAAQQRIPAIAMTDINTLSGAPTFTKDMTGAGIQPIVGIQITIDHAKYPGELVLLAKNETGFKNLVRLTSTSYIRTPDGQDPKVNFDDLKECQAGLIALSGGRKGPMNRALLKGDIVEAGAIADTLLEIFGDRFYAELVRQGTPDEKVTEPKLLALASDKDLALVATNDCYFLEAKDVEAQDALLCIKDGTYLAQDTRRMAVRNAWLKPAEDMRKLFADLPEACDNTVEIAKRCAVAFKKAKPMLPPFPGLGDKTEEEALRDSAKQGLDSRLASYPASVDGFREYYDRLQFELDIISGMGFPGYFLIVADFINWAKDNHIPVGPGRGSGAGSIVAWAMRITDLDPIEYKLLFERFLNPERVSMPDFDIDFCQERREEVIEYVKRRYGADRVGQIGTIGKLKAKAAVRDVGRAMQVPYPVVNNFTSMIVDNPNDPKKLKEAMQIEPLQGELERAEPQVKRMFGLALGVEGLHRNLSTHAAGVVIADRPLFDIVPLFRDKDGNLATQYDMKGVEDAGLVKFDFLGLKTLDAIQFAKDLLNKQGIDIDFDKIGVNDPATYKMLEMGETFGVFQLESVGMTKAVMQVKPTEIGDVIALNALYRPGPMQYIPDYAQVKHGEKQASYLHPLMKKTLKDTNGIIVYQEQVMDLGRRLAGYSLGGADLLRRAMGKKIAEEMAAQRAVFVEGASKGWVELTLDDGRSVHMHHLHKVKTTDGTMVTIEEAMQQNLDVSL